MCDWIVVPSNLEGWESSTYEGEIGQGAAMGVHVWVECRDLVIWRVWNEHGAVVGEHL